MSENCSSENTEPNVPVETLSKRAAQHVDAKSPDFISNYSVATSNGGAVRCVRAGVADVDGSSHAALLCILTDTAVQILSCDGPGHPSPVAQPIQLKGGPVCARWIRDATCVVVGDSTGSLHFISSSGLLLFSQRPPGAQNVFIDIAFLHDGTNAEQLLLLCAANNEGGRGPQLLRFTNMDMSAMLRAATMGDVEGLKKVRSGIGFSRVGLEKFHNVVHGFDVASDEGIVAICGEGACAATVWQREALPSDPKHSSTAAGHARVSELSQVGHLASSVVGCGKEVVLGSHGSTMGLVSADGTLSILSVPSFEKLATLPNDYNVQNVVALSTARDNATRSTGWSFCAAFAALNGVSAQNSADPISPTPSICYCCVHEELVSEDGSPRVRVRALRNIERIHDMKLVGVSAGSAPQRFYAVTLDKNAVDDSQGSDGRPPESPGQTAGAVQLRLQLYSVSAIDTAMTGVCNQAMEMSTSAPPQPPIAQSAHPGLSQEERSTQARGIKLLKMLTSWRPSDDANTGDPDSKLEPLLRELKVLLDSDLSLPTRVAAVMACLNARMFTTSAMRHLLHTLHAGRGRLTATSAGNLDRSHGNTIAQARCCAELVERSCYRFDTWELCFYGVSNVQHDGGQHDGASEENQDRHSWDCTHWSRFQHADGAAMAHNLGTLLACGGTDRAILFWQRHAHRDTAVRDCVADILPLLPTSVAPLDFVPWLLNEVLPHLHMKQRQKIEEWLCQRAQFIENDDGSPHRAFELVCLSLGFNATTANGSTIGELSSSFTDMPLGSMTARVDALSTPTFGIDENRSPESDGTECVRLVDLYQRLRQLTYLWDEPQIRMGLFEFTETSPVGVAMAMIERAANVEELNNEIASQITPFVQQAGLTPDDVFCEFVKQVGQALRGDDALQIMRSMAIIPHIARVSLRLEAVLALLRGSDAPHSKELWSLADNALVWAKRAANKSCVEQLEEQKRFMHLQETLHRYDAQNVDLSDREQVTRLHRHVLSRTERPEALADALQLAAAYTFLSNHSTHVVYLQNLVSGVSSLRNSACDGNDNAEPGANSTISERVVSVLDALDDTPAVLIGEEVLHFSFALLCDIELEQTERIGNTMDAENEDIGQIRARRALSAAEAIVSRLAERSSNMPAHCMSLATSTTTLAELRRLKQIEANFGLIISLATLHDSERCEHLITQRIRVQLDTWCDQMQSSIEFEDMERMEQHDSSSMITPKRCSTHLSFWEMVRLAGFLGFDRSRLLGITAVEAAVVGKVQVAVKCCTELYKRVPSEQTGQLISRVAMKLLQFVDANAAEIFSGEDVNAARTPIVSTALLQMSSVTCAEESLALVMDLYSIMDTVGLAVSQTEMGDYATLLDNAGADEADGGADDGTAAVPSPSTMTLSHVQKLMPERHMNIEWLDSDSVVLKTAPVMQLATRFAVGECGRLLSLSSAADYSHLEYASRGLHEHAANHGAYQLALRVLATSAHFDNIESRTGLEEQRQQLASLLSRVLQSHCVDYSLALGCMMALPIEMAVLTFREQLKREQTHREFRRLQRLGRLGVDVARHCRKAPPSFRQACAQLAINAHWWNVLSKLQIKFEYKTFDAAATTQDPKGGLRKLVKPLLAKTKYDLVAAKEFCAHYQLDDPSLTCIEMLLLLPSGNRPQYRDKIEAVLRGGAVGRNSEQLAEMLDRVIQQFHAMDYEKLLFTLELLCVARGGTCASAQVAECNRITRHIQVLKILLTYYQRGEERRIDFHHLIQDPWKVISPELNTESVVKLVALATPLGISRDDFYVEVVRSMFRDAGHHTTQAEGATAQSQLAAGTTVTARLPDMEEIEPLLQACRPPAATVCAEEVAEHYADGANKLAALELAVHCAQRWSEGELDDDVSCATPGAEASPRECGPGGAERVPSGAACGAQRVCTGKATLRRLTKMAAMAFTALQLNGVKWLIGDAGVEQMLKIGSPHSMIQQLYERFSVAAYKAERCHRGAAGNNGPRSLHSVIDAIALRHEIDVSRLKRKLLNEWLNADISSTTPTSSPTDSLDVRSRSDTPCIFAPSPQERASNIDCNLAIRIVYILSHPVEKTTDAPTSGAADDAEVTKAEGAASVAHVKGAITLLQFAKKTTKVTYAGRLRALRALFLLAPKAVIERVHKDMCDEQLDSLMRFWKLCFFMSECDALRLGIHTMEEFESRDKRELVQGLWRNHRQRNSQSGRVMRLVVTLMVDYAIHDVKLWGAVLRQLQDQGEHRFLLLHALPTIAGSATLCRHLGGTLSSLWQKIVSRPLEELEVAVEQYEKVSSATTGHVSASPDWTANVDSVLSHVVVLLHRCPFASQLDIGSLAVRLASTGGGRFATHALKLAQAIPNLDNRNATTDCIHKMQRQ